MKSILLTLRHEFTCFPCRVSSFWWSRFCWPRGTDLFLTVRFLRWSRSLWPWGTNFFAVRFLQWGRFLWPWGTNLFLQCASFSGVDLFDPEAPVYFLQWITLWHLDSGLIGFLFADSTLASFFVCTKSSSFPLEWFPASKMVLDWDQAFPCLGIGQNGPHLASGIMLLPCCGWCLWSPLQVTWRRSATVVSPDQEPRMDSSNLRKLNIICQYSLSFSFLIFDYFWPCPLLSITKGPFL